MSKKTGEKKVKLPKRVAGVKVPKELRKGGEALIAQARMQAGSEAGRVAIMQGVSVVAGIAATAAAAAAARAKADTAQPAAPTGAAPTPPGDAIAQAVTAGIDAALGRLFPKR